MPPRPPSVPSAMKSLFLLLLLSLLPGPVRALEADPLQAVDPFIGCATNGHTYPGASCPFALVQPSPVTGSIGWQYCAEYLHTDRHLLGFSQTHLSGTGCMDLGDLLLLPLASVPVSGPVRAQMDKSTEAARPGYYRVRLADSGITAELTATPRVAYHRYTFPPAAVPRLLLDLQHGPAWSQQQQDRRVRNCSLRRLDPYTLIGHLETSIWVRRHVYFCLRTNRPLVQTDTLAAPAGNRAPLLLLRFSPLGEVPLEVKISLSTVSEEGAVENMEKELPAWDFPATVRQAQDQWRSLLGRFTLEGTPEQRTLFYTSLYHLFLQPNLLSDTDGQFLAGPDHALHCDPQTPFYSTFSCWDTFRAAHSLYLLATPELVAPFVQSLVVQGEAQGYLPVWALWGGDTHCMTGNHAVAIIAEAILKGTPGIDARRAWAIIDRTLTLPHPPSSRWPLYLRYGYYPADSVSLESVSRTLEHTYDDHAAALLARHLGLRAEARRYARRAKFYENLFCPESHLFRPRLADGRWLTPFDPLALAHAESVGGHYTEGNAWQYAFAVPHAIPRLVRLMGGREAFCRRLDTLFSLRLPAEAATLADVTGLLGLYAHGNEPSHHVAYLYALAGRPAQTQLLVRHICRRLYAARPDGLCGNDDCGQLSAWYVFSTLGFYPVDPVGGRYVLGAPQVPRATLRLPSGRLLRVEAVGWHPDAPFVRSVTLNGRRLRRPYLTHAELLGGGTLRFEMSARPSGPVSSLGAVSAQE